MKTYWLTGRKDRENLSASGRISAVESINQLISDGCVSVSRGYSPILPEEMASFKSRTTTPSPRNSPLQTICPSPGGLMFYLSFLHNHMHAMSFQFTFMCICFVYTLRGSIRKISLSYNVFTYLKEQILIGYSR